LHTQTQRHIGTATPSHPSSSFPERTAAPRCPAAVSGRGPGPALWRPPPSAARWPPAPGSAPLHPHSAPAARPAGTPPPPPPAETAAPHNSWHIQHTHTHTHTHTNHHTHNTHTA